MVLASLIGFHGGADHFEAKKSMTPDIEMFDKQPHSGTMHHDIPLKRPRLAAEEEHQQVQEYPVKVKRIDNSIKRSERHNQEPHKKLTLCTKIPDNNSRIYTAIESDFNAKYEEWLRDHFSLICKMRKACRDSEKEEIMTNLINECIRHVKEHFKVKSMAAKEGMAPYLVLGLWRKPAERPHLWIGGFWPSELLSIIILNKESYLSSFTNEPLFEHQVQLIQFLVESAKFWEESLSEKQHANKSVLLKCIVSQKDTLETQDTGSLHELLISADKVRLHILNQLGKLLFPHQMVKFLLAIEDFFHALRVYRSLVA